MHNNTIEQLLKEGKSYKEISKITGRVKSTISYHAKRLNNNTPPHVKSYAYYDWKQISKYAEDHTRKQCIEKFGFGDATWTKAVNRGDIKSKNIPIPLSEVMTENSTYPRKSLKRRILEEKLLDYKCKCGNTGEWQNQKLVLQLEHKNGTHNDHRLENLEFLCPNCHSQTKTFGSRNRPYKSRVV